MRTYLLVMKNEKKRAIFNYPVPNTIIGQYGESHTTKRTQEPWYSGDVFVILFIITLSSSLRLSLGWPFLKVKAMGVPVKTIV